MKKNDIVNYRSNGMKENLSQFMKVIYCYKKTPYVLVKPIGSNSKGVKVLKSHLETIKE